MRRIGNAALILILLSAAACVPKFTPEGWEFLGKRQVIFTLERAEIPVPPQVKPLRQLMIIVRMNDMNIYNLKVMFDSGADFAPDFRMRFVADRDHEIIDLPGGERRVNQVEFHYRNVRQTARRAEVELWGK